MGIEIVLKCARCDKELDIMPPLLFKDPKLEITVMRCTCKDINKEDLCRAEPEWAANRIRFLTKELKELRSIIGTIRQRR